MYVVSPWSRGGYVASEVFDHTSVIRFLEARFGVHEPNISAWRRAVCGDLTSCFDFSRADDRAFVGALPPTAEMSRRALGLTATEPDLPAALAAPEQERGPRRRRPTPYVLECALEAASDGFALRLSNDGRTQAAVFHVYHPDALDGPPERHTVGAGLSVLAPLRRGGDGAYDAYVLAPGGFHRRLAGRDLRFAATLSGNGAGAILRVQNLTPAPLHLAVADMSYGQQPLAIACAASRSTEIRLDFAASHGWYDLLVEADGERQRLAGHLENGQESFSDPAGFGPARLEIGDI